MTLLIEKSEPLYTLIRLDDKWITKEDSGVRRYKKDIYTIPTDSILFFLLGNQLTKEDRDKIYDLPSVTIKPNIKYSIKINEKKECITLHNLTIHQEPHKSIILYSDGRVIIIEGKDYKKKV